MSIKNFFFETSEKVVSKPVKKAVQQVSVTSSAIHEMNNVYTMADSPEFEHFKAQFAKILEDENKRNFPGNDYHEFITMKNAMNAISQEDIKYQAAFAGWAIGGNQTRKSLIDTAHVYLSLVDREIKEFEEAYEQQYADKVTKNEQVIQQKTKEVQQLIEKMNALNSDISSLKHQNEDETVNLKQKHKAFMDAGENQRQEILGEIEKINNFIK